MLGPNAIDADDFRKLPAPPQAPARRARRAAPRRARLSAYCTVALAGPGAWGPRLFYRGFKPRQPGCRDRHCDPVDEER